MFSFFCQTECEVELVDCVCFLYTSPFLLCFDVFCATTLRFVFLCGCSNSAT